MKTNGRIIRFAAGQSLSIHDKAIHPALYLLPHSVQQCAIILQSQQLVGCGHVVSNRLLAIKEEGIRGPDVTGQQVV